MPDPAPEMERISMMNKLKAKLKKQGGFTLVEMLIVVAIIAVLVAISIPVVADKLEKAREATDAANIRAAYAEVMIAAIEEDTTNYTKTVNITQTEAEWTSTITWPEGLTGADADVVVGGTATITYTPGTGVAVAYAA